MPPEVRPPIGRRGLVGVPEPSPMDEVQAALEELAKIGREEDELLGRIRELEGAEERCYRTIYQANNRLRAMKDSRTGPWAEAPSQQAVFPISRPARFR